MKYINICNVMENMCHGKCLVRDNLSKMTYRTQTQHTLTHASRDSMGSSLSSFLVLHVLLCPSICSDVPSVGVYVWLYVCACTRLFVCMCEPPLSNCVCRATTWQRNTGAIRSEENYINNTVVPASLVFSLLEANTGKQIWVTESEKWSVVQIVCVCVCVCMIVCVSLREREFIFWANTHSSFSLFHCCLYHVVGG